MTRRLTVTLVASLIAATVGPVVISAGQSTKYQVPRTAWGDPDIQGFWSYNDDVNTFDHVINCLVKYCSHDMLQAEQCAFIVHTKGKCSVKNGNYTDLEPVCSALCDKGLSAKIEMH